MNKILTEKQAIRLAEQLNEQSKDIVLVGGCFDILHLGHILFLEKAKEKGEILFVWIEPDETIRQRKGEHRPIHTQQERAQVIAALACVDYVILLPHFTTNVEYDNLVKNIKPAIIAATEGDPEIMHKQRSAKAAGAQIIYVTKNIKGKSTTRLAELVAQET
jgi:rfaE bifunctional protein nucleotidyltransferase chain/domain